MCWSANAVGERFCVDCGTPLSSPCPHCEAELPTLTLLCPSCAGDVRHLAPPAARAPARGLPLVAAFAHPLERLRYQALREVPGFLDLQRAARELCRATPEPPTGLPLGGRSGAALSSLVRQAARAYGCGDVELLRSDEASSPEVCGGWSGAWLVVPSGLASVLDEPDARFVCLAALFPLVAGTWSLSRAAAGEDARALVGAGLLSALERWSEVLAASADRFAAAFAPEPAAWLAAVLKTDGVRGDDLPALLDAVGPLFPRESASVAARLKGHPRSQRRLLELADFARSEGFTALAAQRLGERLAATPPSAEAGSSPGTSSSSGDEAAAAGSADAPREGGRLLGFPLGRQAPLPGRRGRGDGGAPAAGPVEPPRAAEGGRVIPLQPKLEARERRAADTRQPAPRLSGDVLYLSSYRSELVVAGPDLRVVLTVPLGEFARGPRRVALDVPRGRIYVSDSEASVVLALDFRGRLVGRVGSPGRGPGQLRHPTGVAVDPAGRLWVADTWNDRLQRFSAAGAFEVAAEGFAKPTGLRCDPRRGGLWVADTGAGRVVKAGDEGHVLHAFGAGALDHPEDVAVDQAGNVVVADTGAARVRWFEPAGAELRSAPTSGAPLRYPHVVAPGPDGSLLVAERGSGDLTLFAADGTTSVLAPPVPEGHGPGFPCDMLVVEGLVRAAGLSPRP